MVRWRSFLRVRLSGHRRPVVIGGLGGSGTRVHAAFSQLAGYYLGSDLNQAHDNQWVILLMSAGRSSSRIDVSRPWPQACSRRSSCGGGRMTSEERRLLCRTTLDVARRGNAVKGLWAWCTAARLALARPRARRDVILGLQGTEPARVARGSGRALRRPALRLRPPPWPDHFTISEGSQGVTTRRTHAQAKAALP